MYTGTRLAIQGELDILADGSDETLEGKLLVVLMLLLQRVKSRCTDTTDILVGGIALYHAALRPALPQTTTVDRGMFSFAHPSCSTPTE